MDVLKIEIDHAQPRVDVGRDRISTLICGKYDENNVTNRPVEGWSPYWNSDTWVDPITGTLMLMPLPLTEDWKSTGTGDYARLTKASYTLITGASWVDHNTNGDSASYIHCVDSTLTEPVRTAVTYLKNRAFYLSVYAAAADREERQVISIGWDYDNRATTGVTIELFTSGRIRCKIGDVYDAEGSLTQLPGMPSKGVWDTWVGFLFIPMRRGILIYSPTGGGFFWERSDIEPDDDDPTITPAADFWWQCSAGGTVECAPLMYKRFGYRAGVATIWTRAPQSDEFEDITVFHDAPAGSGGASEVTSRLVERYDATANFLPDGIVKECRVRADLYCGPINIDTGLYGDASTSPFVWAAAAVYPALIVDTDGSEVRNLTPYVTRVSLSAPECKRDLTVTITMKGIVDFEAEDAGPIVYFETMGGRPLRLLIGDTVIFDGIASAPTIKRSTHRNDDEFTFECRGLWSLLERYRFSDPYPLDGKTLKEALEFLLGSAGIPSDRYDIEDFAVEIDDVGFPSRGEFLAKIMPGDTAAEWWDRLFDDYLPDCHWCEMPTAEGVKVVAFSPETVPVPDIPYRIFDDIDYARLHLEGEYGLTGEEIESIGPARTYRALDERTIPAEASSIFVQGLMRRTMRPIVASYNKTVNQDPKTKPHLRPEWWTGTVEKYGMIKEAFGLDSQCQDANERLQKRLLYGRKMREIEIDMMIDPENLLPVWIGQEVEVHQYRTGELVAEKWRLTGIGSIDFIREYPGIDGVGQLIARPARYVMQVIVAAEPSSKGLGHNLPGNTLLEMKANSEYAWARNFIISQRLFMPKSLWTPRLSVNDLTE